MTRTLATCATALAAVLALADLASAQQRLFTIDTTGQVSEVIGFQGGLGSLVPIASVPLPPLTITRGRAADRTTGDLFILMEGNNTTRIDRLDVATGQVTPLCSLPLPLVDGLDARFDGTLVFQSNLNTLVFLDPSSCRTNLVPTVMPIGVHTSDGSVAFDERGLVAALGADGTNQRIDPLDGSPSAFNAAIFGGTTALEVDTNGDVYYGQYDGALFRSGAQLFQILPSNGVRISGMAFLEPADGGGMSIACAGLPNSTGVPSTIEIVGTAVAAEEDLELLSRDLPPNSFGYFLVGPNSGSMPLGQGLLCIGAPQYRYSLSVQDAGASGAVRFDIDLSALPNGATVVAGDRYIFQYWHRDSGSTSNLSPALDVTFR